MSDGEALIRWVEKQPWSDGRIGVFGDSASGVASLQAGAALGDMFDAVEEGDPGKSTRWTRAITPDVPIASELQPRWRDLLATGSSASARASQDVTDRITAPTLHVSLWHDFFQASAFKAFGRMQAARGNQKLIVLDGTHYDVDDTELWPSRPMFAWFDHWLKGVDNGVPAWPNVQRTVAGKPAAGLLGPTTWPPAATTLHTRTLAAPEGALTIDPASPAPAPGGNHLTVSSGMQVLEAGAGDIVVKLVDRRADGEVRLLRETAVALAGAGTVTADFSGLADECDAGSAPGLVVAEASLPGCGALKPPLSGTVRLGTAALRLHLAP
ncbi:MAG: CocE/NonD family hydrolase [Burkholderiales bacterium]